MCDLNVNQVVCFLTRKSNTQSKLFVPVLNDKGGLEPRYEDL